MHCIDNIAACLHCKIEAIYWNCCVPTVWSTVPTIQMVINKPVIQPENHWNYFVCTKCLLCLLWWLINLSMAFNLPEAAAGALDLEKERLVFSFSFFLFSFFFPQDIINISLFFFLLFLSFLSLIKILQTVNRVQN